MEVRRTPKARVSLVVVAAVLALVAAAGAASPSRAKTTKPTIVLVHGAWADSSSWAGVVRRLQRTGYTVDVPPNPLRDLTSDSDYLRSILTTIKGPIVLVGHSYGGAVVTNAVGDNPNVKALVYINAFAPDQGESVLQLATAKPGSSIGGDPTKVFNVVPYPGGPQGDVDLYVKPRLFPKAFGNDLPTKTGAVLAATQRPVALSALAEPSGPPAWKTVPSWYMVGTKDNVIPVAEQRVMAKRAGSHVAEVPASHMSMVSHPQQVAAIIMTAAAAR